MKYILTIAFAGLFLTQTFAQNELRAAMGIDFGSIPSLKDYVNQVAGYEVMGSFGSAVIFSGEYDRALSKSYEMGFEVAYLLNSVTFSTYGTYDFTYHIIMPTVMSYYVIRGDGYNFKFGGGVGLRLLSADESIPATPAATNYTSAGPGFLLRAAGNTRLSGDFFVYIAGNLRYDLNGDLKGWSDHHTSNYNQVNMDIFSASINLGITYTF